MSCTTFIFFSATHDFLVQYHSSYLSSQSSAFCDPHSSFWPSLYFSVSSLLVSWFPALCRHTCMSLPAVKSLQFKDRLHSTLTCSTGHSPGCLPSRIFTPCYQWIYPVCLSHSLWYMLHKSFVLNKVFTLSDLLPIVPASESKTLY